jgi:hypothetical protein
LNSVFVEQLRRVSFTIRSNSRLVLLLVGYSLFALTWLVTNPLGAVPDEAAHYIKALGAGEGQLVGSRLKPRQWPTVTKNYVWRNSRAYVLPAQLIPPPDVACTKFNPEISAACQKNWPNLLVRKNARIISTEGNYPPYLYLIPGLFTKMGRTAWDSMMLARLANLLLCLLLIGFAVALSWDRTFGAASLLGIVLAFTPMCLFLFASANSNGVEIAGAFSMTAGLLALGRRSRPPRWYWWSSALGASILSLGRTTGVGFAILIFVTMFTLWGWDRVKQLANSVDKSACWTSATVAAAIIAGVTWELAMDSHPMPSTDLALRAFWPNLIRVPPLLYEQVGLFGWLDTAMPRFVYRIWLSLIFALVGFAFFAGSNRQRFALVTASVSVFVSQEVIGVVILSPTGFGLQGRHSLAMAIAIPLIASHILLTNNTNEWIARFHRITPVIFCIVGFLQFIGWYANSRRYAVGINGAWIFLKSAQWAPVGGWPVWIVLASIASLAIACAGFFPFTEANPVRMTVVQSAS